MKKLVLHLMMAIFSLTKGIIPWKCKKKKDKEVFELVRLFGSLYCMILVVRVPTCRDENKFRTKFKRHHPQFGALLLLLFYSIYFIILLFVPQRENNMAWVPMYSSAGNNRKMYFSSDSIQLKNMFILTNSWEKINDFIYFYFQYLFS